MWYSKYLKRIQFRGNTHTRLVTTNIILLFVGVVITNVSVMAKWHNLLSYFMWSRTSLDLLLGFNDIYSLFHIYGLSNFYDLD